MRIKVSKTTIMQFLIFFSFFEIGLFNALENNGGSFVWYAIDRIYAILRVLLALFAFCIYDRKVSTSVGKSISLFLIIRIIACIINKDPYILNIVLGSFTTIGFVILCESFVAKDFTHFVKNVYYFFGVYSLLNVISVLVFPYGFINKNIAFFGNAYSIYFLGGKNGAMFFYAVYLFAAIYLKKTKSKRTNPLLINIVLLISAVMLQSANTVVGISVVLAYQLIDKNITFMKKFFSPMNITIGIIAFTIVTLTNLRNYFYGPLIQLINKDLTFSGRIYLWEDAINHIIDKPLFGSGTDIQYSLVLSYETRNYAQCHSVYLDYFAKYGLFTLLSLVFVFIAVFFNRNTKSNKDMKYLSSMFMFVMLLHSVFDDISLYFVGLICIISLALKQFKNTNFGLGNYKKKMG